MTQDFLNSRSLSAVMSKGRMISDPESPEDQGNIQSGAARQRCVVEGWLRMFQSVIVCNRGLNPDHGDHYAYTLSRSGFSGLHAHNTFGS